MEKIKYSILKYYNSAISEECLCVGILFHNISTNQRTFNAIKNFKRLESFDDEIDIEFFKCYLSSIKEETENNIFNFNQEFNIENYVKTYVNELRFSKIYTSYNPDEEFIKNTTKLFLKFDYSKGERLHKNLETLYIRNILKENGISFTSKPVIGSHKEPIHFDYQTDNYAIKIFSFKEKNLSKLISSAKTWSYNALELKPHKKTIFLYDLDILNSKEFRIIMDILSEHAYQLLPFEEGLDIITKIS